ncbi:type 4a pilus biogenesis protein PilO [Tepidiphilus margaritifer]|uniref:type 4a pilus biogenesis protein PilO n=1 Tax=Tepidiphilus margaritifer TaxID=203471 RepID=UPI00042006AF|nr:type 4a pilus biogenesis protein PilO [Tepidiphilus margaritifer]
MKVDVRFDLRRDPLRWIRQFRDLDPQDPGRWPPAPQITVMVLLFALIVAGAWWFFWTSQAEELERVKGQEKELRDQWLAKKRQAVNLPEYRAQLRTAEAQFGALLKQLPSKSEMDALLQDVHQFGLKRGLRFELFRPGDEARRDFYVEMPVAIVLEGGYHEIAGFLSDVSSMPRVVTFGDIKLAPQKDVGLKFEATLHTYRYLDEEELNATAAQPAGKGGKK